MSDFAMTDDCGLLINLQIFILIKTGTRSEQLLIMLRNETLSLSLGFRQVSNHFFKSQMENKRGHVNRA